MALARRAFLVCAFSAIAFAQNFHFVILGDRTGETVPGVYEQVWREAASENPVFVVSVGDTIQGSNDTTAEREWQVLNSYKQFPFYLAAGNHDIWSAESARLFRKYAGHAPHYEFDFRQAHFTILDNSRSDQFSAEELAFLEKDLQAHKAQPLKFVVSHRPSWVIDAMLQNPNFPLHQLAKKYGVQYVIAGHVHQMLHMDLEGVTYLSVPSSGGHLRASGKYEDGWFFAYTVVDVTGEDVSFHIKELKPPKGQGRVTVLKDWGKAGLVAK